MKKAIIKVHGNPTLSRIVQELAIRGGFDWGGITKGTFDAATNSAHWLYFGYDGNSIQWDGKTRSYKGRHIDAATEFDKVIAFFEQPQRPVIKVGEHTVEWMDAQNAIKVGCTVVPAETVKAIHDELFKK